MISYFNAVVRDFLSQYTPLPILIKKKSVIALYTLGVVQNTSFCICYALSTKQRQDRKETGKKKALPSWNEEVLPMAKRCK